MWISKKKTLDIIGFDIKKKKKWKVSAYMYLIVVEDSIYLGIKQRNTNFIACHTRALLEQC